MRVPVQLLDYYLSVVTVAYYNDHDSPPDEVEGYEEFVDSMAANAERRGDLETLKTAFAHLLAHPEIDCSRFGGGRYPYDDEEMREILAYVQERLGGDERRDAAVELVQQPLEDYWRSRPQAGAN